MSQKHFRKVSETIKVGISGVAISEPWAKWATSKSTQLSTNVWVKLLLLLENALKLNFWGPLTNWKFEPCPRAHTLTPSSINTQNRSKTYVWIYHGMHWPPSYRSKLSNTLRSKDLGILAFKKIPDTPTKTSWSRAQFQNGRVRGLASSYYLS